MAQDVAATLPDIDFSSLLPVIPPERRETPKFQELLKAISLGLPDPSELRNMSSGGQFAAGLVRGIGQSIALREKKEESQREQKIEDMKTRVQLGILNQQLLGLKRQEKLDTLNTTI